MTKRGTHNMLWARVDTGGSAGRVHRRAAGAAAQEVGWDGRRGQRDVGAFLPSGAGRVPVLVRLAQYTSGSLNAGRPEARLERARPFVAPDWVVFSRAHTGRGRAEEQTT